MHWLYLPHLNSGRAEAATSLCIFLMKQGVATPFQWSHDWGWTQSFSQSLKNTFSFTPTTCPAQKHSVVTVHVPMCVWGPTPYHHTKHIKIHPNLTRNLIFAPKESWKDFYNFVFEISPQVPCLINYGQWFLTDHACSRILSKWKKKMYSTHYFKVLWWLLGY